ncbi:MFS transporter [bacterium]|nr:MFS transporter [bacterium]
MKINKSIFGWMAYDFANSSFTTIIVTVVYSVYFKTTVVGDRGDGSFLWGLALAISMFLVAITAPIFGAVADYSRAKKKFLFYNTYLSVIFTILLGFVGPGSIFTGMLFFIIANFGFHSAIVFYDSFLSEIATTKHLGRISGFGWAFGYVGGLVSLVLALWLVNLNKITLVFPMVGVFYGVFAIFTFVLLKEFRRTSKRANYFKIAYQRISISFSSIKSFRDLGTFLVSFFFYNDAISTAIGFTMIYGQERYGMTTDESIKVFILAQLTSILGAFIFGYIADKIGHKKTLSICLFIWLSVIVWAFLSPAKKDYYVVILLAGFAIGSTQANSRAMIASLTPKSKNAEFFGFYTVTGRMSAVIGPILFGLVSKWTGNIKYSILTVIPFFLLGLITLQRVNEKRGQLIAREWKEDNGL